MRLLKTWYRSTVGWTLLALIMVPQCRGDGNRATYSKDIAPIVFEHCTSCHRAGGGGPFELTAFEHVRKRARQIKDVVETRFMPPWHAVQTRHPFANDPSLSNDEIRLIQSWVDGGTPEGDPALLPELPTYGDGWELGPPDVVLKMDRAYTIPADGPDIYRYFGFSLSLPEDRWVRALEYLPGRRSVAHHALVFATDDKEWKALDKEERAIGFEKWTGQRRGARRILSWALGTNARVFPKGVGLLIKKGEDLVLQAHFHPSGGAEDEISSIGIYFSDEKPEQESIEIQVPQSFGSLSGIEIPAGVADYTLRESFLLPVPVKAYATMPHAHYIGKEFELNAFLPGGETHALLRVDDWDFAWQHLYRFAEPFVLPKGTRLEAVIRWDNSASNPFNPFDPPKQINWGPYSEDEMGSIILDVVAFDQRDERQLKRALRDYRTATLENLLLSRTKALADGLKSVDRRERRIAIEVLKKYDRDGNGRLDAEELSLGRRAYREKGFDGGLKRAVPGVPLQARLDP